MKTLYFILTIYVAYSFSQSLLTNRASHKIFQSKTMLDIEPSVMKSVSKEIETFYLSEKNEASRSEAIKLISIVLKKYKIKVPTSVTDISFDGDLYERGLASVSERYFIKSCSVLIGNEAFSSETVLASTLIHELQGHCQQSTTLIHLKNLPSLFGGPRYGDMWAEYQAYGLELKSGLPHSRDWVETLNGFRDEFRSNR